jgi:DNA-binding XRE family transcriptional regulator
MKTKNHLRKYRKDADLTQAALGELIGANQQLIQRIESGITPPKLVIAEAIANQLNLKVHQIFPHLKKSIDALDNESFKYEALGLEHYLVYFYFKNGQQLNHVMSGESIENLHEELDMFGQERHNNYDFFVFDTETHRVAINPRLLSHWTVMPRFGPSMAQVGEEDLDEESALNVLFSNGQWRTFDAEPDFYSVEDNEEELEAAQGDLEMPLGDFFYYLEDKYSPMVSFCDPERNTTYFQKEDIAEVHIALRFVRPVLDEFDEEADED